MSSATVTLKAADVVKALVKQNGRRPLLSRVTIDAPATTAFVEKVMKDDDVGEDFDLEQVQAWKRVLDKHLDDDFISGDEADNLLDKFPQPLRGPSLVRRVAPTGVKTWSWMVISAAAAIFLFVGISSFFAGKQAGLTEEAAAHQAELQRFAEVVATRNDAYTKATNLCVEALKASGTQNFESLKTEAYGAVNYANSLPKR